MSTVSMPERPQPQTLMLPPIVGDVLRFTTAGSVDDGKSTLIGRLLYDSQGVYEDQLDSVRASRINRSGGPIDFSLLTDGLRAEREQGITIDVAYRYFSTPRRKFIIADTPGHEQYTRNMVTGASTANAAIVLIDATKGLLPQSRRHAYIARLLEIPYIVAAVNKMDLVGYSQKTFEAVAADFERLSEQIGFSNVCIVPISALQGDNVVRSSSRIPWFEGPPLLEYLESVPSSDHFTAGPLRLPVQYVIRPNSNFRGFAGRIAAGRLRPQDAVIALPSGLRTRVKSIVTYGGDARDASAGDSVTVTLEHEVDLSRGDLLVSENASPAASQHLSAKLVWMSAEALDQKKLYLLKHTTRTVRARVNRLLYRIDVNSFQQTPSSALAMNDIAAVELKTTLPLFFDSYRQNRTMGSFILIDPLSNATVAAGMIDSAIEEKLSLSVLAIEGRVTTEERAIRFGHAAAAIWVTDRPQLAEELERKLFNQGWHVQLITSSEFAGDQFGPAAKALRLAGAVTVFSVSDADEAHKQTTKALFGPEAFFASEDTNRSDIDVTTELVEALNQWRGSYPGTWKQQA